MKPAEQGSNLAASVTDEWRKGWAIVALTLIALLCSPATLPVYTIGVFSAHLEDSFQWSRAAIQAAILFSTGLGLIGGPLGGWMVKRYGVRRAVVSGVTGLSLAVLLCSQMTGSPWQFYALYGLMALSGAGAGAVAWTFLIADNFTRSRGLALGIALSGTGIAAMALPKIAQIGIAEGGWRGGYIGLGLFGLCVILPLCLWLLPRGRSAQTAEEGEPLSGLTMGQALRGRHFWLLGLATCAIYMAVGGLIPNMVPALTDAGLSEGDAVAIMGFFGFAIMIGRMVVGWLVDHLWAPLVATAVLIPAAIACFLFQMPLSFATYAVAAMVIGMATGMEFDMLGFLAARYFGLADFATIYGRLYMFVAVGAGSAPLAFGFAYDRTGSYAIPLSLSAGLMVAGAAGFLALGRYPEFEKR